MDLTESKRLNRLSVFEDSLYLQGYEFIAGIDEVGKGALAGPIVSAAVILPRKNYFIEKINDSKKLDEELRKGLSKKIISSCVCYGIGKISSQKIDKVRLSRANTDVFRKALRNLNKKPDIILTDALYFKSEIPVMPIIKGDELSISISAASIIAKVIRDKIMQRFDKIYPGYDFYNNKGYGTYKHLRAIKKLGFCPIHRKSFKINLPDI